MESWIQGRTGNFIHLCPFVRICEDYLAIILCQSGGQISHIFIFLKMTRFAQLDVRPALDSAEAVQDRMKVTFTKNLIHQILYLSSDQCLIVLLFLSRLLGGGSKQSGLVSCPQARKRVSSSCPQHSRRASAGSH